MVQPIDDEDENSGDEEIDALHKKPNKGTTIETKQTDKKSKSKFALLAKKATYGMEVDITDKDNMGELERAIHEDSEKFDIKTERAFAWLQVCTASLDIFAHGSNDVANAVAPFAAIVAIYETESISSSSVVPWW
eukprot:CAMPEP_0201567484 /NCGR_PEP_ID=MMETSP0190_2-20130828/7986_1 /ASSEMBLY_ACC=CAM_ASM_000263 /TAXON_ID=37353 /ORGANISM="Rosalina sp." /LENGTH=134 /DNA_ID=CAMNT_0047987535 /DNA_START=922 /DNA_END=1323 /DNA_ORIENTATION=+